MSGKKGRRPTNPDQPSVIQAWRDLGAAARGFVPTVDAKVYRAANLLLQLFTVEEIREMIAIAFRDPWFVTNGTLMNIKSNPDKYRPRVAAAPSTQTSDVPYHAEWTPPWQ